MNIKPNQRRTPLLEGPGQPPEKDLGKTYCSFVNLDGEAGKKSGNREGYGTKDMRFGVIGPGNKMQVKPVAATTGGLPFSNLRRGNR